jgi:hypothetical protein
MRWHATAAALCACVTLVACDIRVPGTTTTTTTITSQTCMHRVNDPAARARYEEALAAQSVEFELVDPADGHGGVFIRAHDADCEKLSAIRLAIEGPDLPNGRHMAFDPRTQVEFTAWLTEQGIPYETRVRDGREYVIWAAADTDRVVRWRHFPRGVPGHDGSAAGAPGKADPAAPPRS